jgi:hypothetical protein
MILNMYILKKNTKFVSYKNTFLNKIYGFEKYTSKNMFSLTHEKLNQRPNKNMSLATFVETMV